MKWVAGAFVVAALLLPADFAFAEAWPRGRGGVYVYTGFATFSADTLYSARGEAIPFPGRDTEETRWSLYLEAGLTDSLTLVASVPWKKIRTRGNVSTFETSGLADLDVRLRQSFGLRSTWIALEGGAVIPTGYDESEFPQLGTGELDWIGNVGLGTSLRFLPEGFLAADVGYRWRGGGISDEIPYSVKVGAFPHERAGIFLFARGWKSRADWSEIGDTIGLLVTDSERLAAGVELYIRLNRSFDLNVVWTDVLDGRNTGKGDEVKVGLAWSR